MYTYTWRKYLPLIRLLLKKSATGTQSVALNQVDFLKYSKTRKPSLTFSIEVTEGKYSVLKLPAIAAELLEILNEDQVTKGIIRSGHYTFALAKNCTLVIENHDAPGAEAEAKAEPEAQPEEQQVDSDAEVK
ncbi:MAG: hypothetical protein EOO09_06975 [Chitinophagaceae bacterium]|nr:MAG: hypothetical protein EOO09_06975 [Chitinophagaceae bacterium]